jgi:uncharacterized membrane protein
MTNHQSPAQTSSQQPGLAFFAIGMMGLGMVALIFGDFALVWQPVAAWIPGRTALAYGSGALMMVCGAGLLFRSTVAWSIRILMPYLIVWQLLKLPSLFQTPGTEAVYLGFGELAILLAGGWTLFARLGAQPDGSPLTFAASERAVRMARFYFGLWITPIGLSHLMYAGVTATYVPAWLPYRVGWAYLTGAGQIASGLGLMFRVFPRAAAWAEAGQITLYTLLVWVPAVVSGPKTRMAWTAFFISWTFAAGAWIVAQNVEAKRLPAPAA